MWLSWSVVGIEQGNRRRKRGVGLVCLCGYVSTRVWGCAAMRVAMFWCVYARVSVQSSVWVKLCVVCVRVGSCFEA